MRPSNVIDVDTPKQPEEGGKYADGHAKSRDRNSAAKPVDGGTKRHHNERGNGCRDYQLNPASDRIHRSAVVRHRDAFAGIANHWEPGPAPPHPDRPCGREPGHEWDRDRCPDLETGMAEELCCAHDSSMNSNSGGSCAQRSDTSQLVRSGVYAIAIKFETGPWSGWPLRMTGGGARPQATMRPSP
jgi:hypothetical protein